jgi:hypothetical protein
MNFKTRFGKVFFCAVLGFAAFGGAYMRPDEIEDLMDTMNRPKLAQILPETRETGDDLIRELLGASLPDAEGGEDAI